DLDTTRDWARQAWREGHATGRGQLWGTLGVLAAAAAALVAVLVLRPWAPDGPVGPDPAGPDATALQTSETFVFQRLGSTEDPVVPGSPPGAAEVPGVAELSGSTWLLVGHVADG